MDDSYRWLAIGLGTLAGIVAFTSASCGGQHVYLVKTKPSAASNLPASRPKLSPPLQATKDSKGILKGFDSGGSPIIAVESSDVENLKKSSAVRTITADVPTEFELARNLKVSYDTSRVTDAYALSDLGLSIREANPKGGFAIAEPTNHLVDWQLLERLERDDRVRYVTPAYHFKAIQADPD